MECDAYVTLTGGTVGCALEGGFAQSPQDALKTQLNLSTVCSLMPH